MSLQGAPPYAGGCLCGAVRYRVDSKAVGRIAHCHCTMCRKAVGATVVDWVTFRRADWHVTKGKPRVFRSSAHAERSFCDACGTSLTFWSEAMGEFLDITAGSLDAPDQAVPDCHIFTTTRLPWMQLDTHLPDELGDLEGV